jgi:hypothetical protein
MKLIKKLSASRDEKKVRERNRGQKQVQKKHEAVDRSIADLADARSEAIRLLKRVVWVLGDNAGARSGGAIVKPRLTCACSSLLKDHFRNSGRRRYYDSLRGRWSRRNCGSCFHLGDRFDWHRYRFA